jgi:chromosome segregation ATPase
VLALAIVAGLLFVLGGVMTGLFVAKGSELSSTREDLNAQVAERDTTIKTKNDEIGKLEGELDKAKAQLDEANQKLGGTQNERDNIQKEKQAIAKCLRLIEQMFAAAANGGQAAVERLGDQVDKACTEAEKYL